jgi:hypothetical protein
VITTRRNVISTDWNKIPASQNEISPGQNGIASRQIAIPMSRKDVSTNPQIWPLADSGGRMKKNMLSFFDD